MSMSNTSSILPDNSQPHILEGIDSPADLRALDPALLPQLCSEIRTSLIKHLSKNPGHFGSSMGAVEIIVALHYVFNTPRDRIVFDVGHQAYAHKLLTGRREAFKTQRTLNGISGFPFPAESEYDTFVCGHAGNSISAALGMATADLNTPSEKDRQTVALIGDASIGNGLAFEGLNNVSNTPNNLLIILNDNDMSIDDNVGALHSYLSDLTTSARYNRWRFNVYKLFKKFNLINDQRKGALLRFNNALKALVAKQQNIFEGLNIRYFGPFDGNDINKVVKVLNDIKDMKGPRILHLKTTKGKGFQEAEKNPAAWHAPGLFEPSTGVKIKGKTTIPLWQEVFGEKLVNLAGDNENILAITAAMPSGTSVSRMLEAYPERTFDVGISEGHAVTFAGGLAAAGKHPFVAVYSSFLQRGFDNIIHDVAIQKLPVTFCIDRGGLVGEDGVTHHGLFDIAYMRMIPEMIVSVPRDGDMLRSLMTIAADYNGPFAIRYPRGRVPEPIPAVKPVDLVTLPRLTIGQGETLLKSPGSKIALLPIGSTVPDALKAAETLRKQGISVDIYDMIWVKPLDADLLKVIATNHDYIVTIEDGILSGGFGDAVADAVNNMDIVRKPIIRKLGVSDRWVSQGSVSQLKHLCEIDADAIVNEVKNHCISNATANAITN